MQLIRGKENVGFVWEDVEPEPVGFKGNNAMLFCIRVCSIVYLLINDVIAWKQGILLGSRTICFDVWTSDMSPCFTQISFFILYLQASQKTYTSNISSKTNGIMAHQKVSLISSHGRVQEMSSVARLDVQCADGRRGGKLKTRKVKQCVSKVCYFLLLFDTILCS